MKNHIEMEIKTNDNQIIITDGVQTVAGNAGTFGYTYSIPTDSVTITKDGKSVTTGALSNSKVNGEVLTPTNIDEKMKPIFLTLSGGGGGITEEVDPLFIEWKNGTSIAAGNNVILSGALSNYNVAIGNDIALNNQVNSVTIGRGAKGSSRSIAIGWDSSTVEDSIAIGSGSKASKKNSVLIGAGTTNNPKEIGIGYLPNSIIKTTLNTTADATHLAIASYSSSTTSKKNVIEARQNDDIYIYKDGSQIKLQDHLGSVNRKVINVTDTKIRLDADADLIYVWDFNSNVPFTSFTMEEDAVTAALSTTNSATIVLKFTGSQSSSITVTLPKNLVYSTDADAKYFINTVNASGSESAVTSFQLKGNEMKVINIYGIGDKRIMEIDY